jgi:predicted esterase
VAALCQQQQEQHQEKSAHNNRKDQQPQQQQQQQQQRPACLPRLRFAVLASGYVSPALAHQALLCAAAPLQLPSLHVYAAAGSTDGTNSSNSGPSSGADNASATDGSSRRSHDRQVPQALSEQLAALFEPSGRVVVTHSSGHIVPLEAVPAIKAFLERVQAAAS